MNEKVGESRQIAQFAQRTRYQDLPESVIDITKSIILDQLGVELACSTLPWNKLVYDYAKGVGATGRSTVVNYGLKTSPEFAAIVNATFGHGFEIDDVQIEALNHPGCVSVPPAVAVGEEYDISGKGLIAASAIGCEVNIRVGMAGRSMLPERGIHPVSAQGTFAAAAAAGNIMELDEEKMLNALSLAGSHSSGPSEYSQGGGDVKRLHAGLAAMGGIRAALLARLGFTGPPAILEGKRGLLQAFCNAYDPSELTNGLGEVYHVLNIGFKPYCCCALIHAPIDTVAKIMTDNKLKSEDIAEISIGAPKMALQHVGSVGPAPQDISSAQFSVHFGLGLTVAKGANDFKTYTDAVKSNFKDPDVLNISRRVTMHFDQECEQEWPQRFIAKATIKTKDGRVLSERVTDAKGAAGNPMTREELEEKFMVLATSALPEKQAEEVKEMVMRLEELDNINRLTQLLVA